MTENSLFQAEGKCPVLPFLVFLEFLVFFCLARISLFFLSVFPFVSRDFRSSAGIKNPCFFVVFLAVFPKKKQGKEGQGGGFWTPKPSFPGNGDSGPCLGSGGNPKQSIASCTRNSLKKSFLSSRDALSGPVLRNAARLSQFGDFLRGGNGRGGGPHPCERYNVCPQFCRDTRTVTRVQTSPSLLRDDQNLRDNRA